MSASNDADEAMIARWETVGHGIYTGENAVEFARLIALARRATAAEARTEELEAETAKCGDCCGVSDDEYTSIAKLCMAQGKRIAELEAGLKRLADAVGNMKAPQNTLDVGVLVLVTVGPALEHARKLLENKP